MKFYIKSVASVLGAVVLGATLIVAPAATASAAPLSTQSVGTCTNTVANPATGGKTYTSPATASRNRDCRLEQGNQGSPVTRLQQELKNGCDSAPQPSLVVDGQFGAATKAALIKAQRELGITADGIYGTESAKAFSWLTTDGSLCYHPGL